ncbi:conserved hypothetical protein [Hyella patelloides LEGE 07179]|uniref:Uncharacterized protein n=1 Tax=Hyella patelloides LEGE 07179 TaxID=945734 RepID=A0A563VWT6_9CYAN|nr:conserved hypothetical protein [Hyella patelloides LEGE 07179]
MSISILFATIYNCAGVAQLVELLICNQPVAGSSPVTSLCIYVLIIAGFQSLRLQQTYCKSITHT